MPQGSSFSLPFVKGDGPQEYACSDKSQHHRAILSRRWQECKDLKVTGELPITRLYGQGSWDPVWLDAKLDRERAGLDPPIRRPDSVESRRVIQVFQETQ